MFPSELRHTSLAIALLRVHVRLVLEKQRHHRCLPCEAGEHHYASATHAVSTRRHAGVVRQVHRNLALQKKRHQLLAPRPAGATDQCVSPWKPMQRSVAVAVAQKEVGAAVDEQSRGFDGIAAAGSHQRRCAVHERERTLGEEIGGAVDVDAVFERAGDGGDVAG